LEDLSRDRIESQVADLKAFQARLSAIDRARLSFDDEIDAQLIDNGIRAALLELTVVRSWERNPMLYAGLPGNAIDSLIEAEFRAGSGAAALRHCAPVAGPQGLCRRPAEPDQSPEGAHRRRGADGALARSGSWKGAWCSGRRPRPQRHSLLTQFEQAQRPRQPRARSFSVAREGPLAALARQLRHRRRDVPGQAPERGDGHASTAGAARTRRGAACEDHAAFLNTAREIDPFALGGGSDEVDLGRAPNARRSLPSVARSVEAARQFIVEKQIVAVPSQVRVQVAPTPPYARSGSFASMDTPGPYELKATEAFYYVTPVEPEWDDKHKEEHLRLFNPWVIGMINVHEAYPGHYLQFLYAPLFPTKTRKLVALELELRGWAHYAEQMTVDQGFGGRQSEDAARPAAGGAAARLPLRGRHQAAHRGVDRGARREAVRRAGFQEPANAYEEARRGAYNPRTSTTRWGSSRSRSWRASTWRGRTRPSSSSTTPSCAGPLPIPLIRKILLR